MLNSPVVSGMYRKNNKSFNINNNIEEELAGSEILGDEDDEDEVDELTLPIEEEDAERKFNGMHDTPSESEGSICSFTERPGSSADTMNLNDGKEGHRNRMSLKSAKTGIHFSSHLQSEKSLFSDKNLSTGLTNSSMSLNSWNRRPSFNASLYGSTSALSDSRLLNVKSPFYDGQTIYGGASTYAKNISRMQKALRVPVQIRPVSSLSTSSSSNTSNNNPVLSNTAKRILDLMNQFNVSSPLNDAKKMGNTLSSRVQPLSLARHNQIVEDELNLNRSIRLNSAKSPYTRPDNKVTRPVNKSLTTELQIPSVSHLLQIKRLQNKTEELRQLANESKSILNTSKTTTEYQLPSNNNKDSDLLKINSNKHTNKLKNKISATRPDKKQTNDDEPPPPVNLPNISFPAMKSVPQFDISLPASKSDSSRPSENNILSNTTSKINSNAMATPKLGTDSSPSNLLRSENFKFEFSSPNRSLNPASLSNNVNKKPKAANAEFSFSEPIVVSEKVKAPLAASQNHWILILSLGNQFL
jgi:nuclear pore complex protein Nup153